MKKSDNKARVINSVAPIRVCDNGGWTDTWFAEYGRIFNIGVNPYAEVQIEAKPLSDDSPRITIFAENYGDRYTVNPEQLGWDKHPLLEASIERMGVPDNLAIKVTIFSEAPAGASTGTSASVTVALIGALDKLTPGRLTPHEVAYLAHSVETQMLKQQCGIQDQLCSAYGGINFIEMFKYPYACVSQIQVTNAFWWELERRLALVYLGKSHSSSKVHERVITHLQNVGPDCKQLESLRNCAIKARDAVSKSDLVELGQAMIDNTEGQRNLSPELVCEESEQIIEIAKAHGAVGWKVNGAGGDGGSITILSGELTSEKRPMIREIERANPLFKSIPIYLSKHGLRVWEANGCA